MLTATTKQGKLRFITGLVAKSKATSFERILFRATRGNLLFKKAEVEEPVLDPATGDKVWLRFHSSSSNVPWAFTILFMIIFQHIIWYLIVNKMLAKPFRIYLPMWMLIVRWRKLYSLCSILVNEQKLRLWRYVRLLEQIDMSFLKMMFNRHKW